MKVFKDYRNRRKLFFIALIYAFLISTYLSLHTFSKYVSTTNDKVGTRGVARWNIELDTSSSSNIINLVSGNDTSQQSYVLSITSTSEVAAQCQLEVSNLPTGLQMQVDNGSLISESNHIIEISNFCSFNANDQNNTKSFILKFIAPIDVNSVTNQKVDINVTCKQKSI